MIVRHEAGNAGNVHQKFRDFRRDNKLDTRQFQMAFRTLRQLSVQIDSSERELDIDATITTPAKTAVF